ncbi:MAG: hypothetical protein HY704_09420 [Gemmatimonadetes bacterium]|nr:hypothetical protein [Gemmatimonadota bacterium]
MFVTKTVSAAALAAVLMSTGACVDLGVTNLNEPDRGRALATPGDVESLISGTFRTWWDLQQGRAPGPAMASLADEQSASQGNYGFQDQGQEPSTPIINETAYQWGYWVYDPWQFTYRALASIRDALQSIDELKLKIGPDGRDNARAQAFAKFMQALFLGNMALQYDRGFILDETVADPLGLKLVPSGELMAAARQKLAAARQIASQSTFTIPGGWMGPDAYTSATLIRLTHSYEARFMAAVARTPEERAQVDWNGVLSHVNQGVVQDFGVQLDGPTGVWNIVMKRQSGPGAATDLALIGPSDQAGAYIAYEKTPPHVKISFLIDTDDRRITGGTPTSPGAYVEYRASLIQPAERGLWFQSNYARMWYFSIAQTGFGFAPELTVEEMGFLAAEAYIRTGKPELALPLINKDRVAVGKLPPATVAGATGARCVPRSAGLLAKAAAAPEGACGNLMQTLIYEKDLELAFLYAGRSWYDHRGYGTLRTGRAIQCPIPAVDLELLGLPKYTFGGVGGPSAAR